MKDTTKKEVMGYGCATAICLMALYTDGITALTLSLGVAAAMAGGAGYVVGRVKGAK